MSNYRAGYKGEAEANARKILNDPNSRGTVSGNLSNKDPVKHWGELDNNTPERNRVGKPRSHAILNYDMPPSTQGLSDREKLQKLDDYCKNTFPNSSYSAGLSKTNNGYTAQIIISDRTLDGKKDERLRNENAPRDLAKDFYDAMRNQRPPRKDDSPDRSPGQTDQPKGERPPRKDDSPDRSPGQTDQPKGERPPRKDDVPDRSPGQTDQPKGERPPRKDDVPDRSPGQTDQPKGERPPDPGKQIKEMYDNAKDNAKARSGDPDKTDRELREREKQKKIDQIKAATQDRSSQPDPHQSPPQNKGASSKDHLPPPLASDADAKYRDLEIRAQEKLKAQEEKDRIAEIDRARRGRGGGGDVVDELFGSAGAAIERTIAAAQRKLQEKISEAKREQTLKEIQENLQKYLNEARGIEEQGRRAAQIEKTLKELDRQLQQSRKVCLDERLALNREITRMKALQEAARQERAREREREQGERAGGRSR